MKIFVSPRVYKINVTVSFFYSIMRAGLKLETLVTSLLYTMFEYNFTRCNFKIVLTLFCRGIA